MSTPEKNSMMMMMIIMSWPEQGELSKTGGYRINSRGGGGSNGDRSRPQIQNSSGADHASSLSAILLASCLGVVTAVC